MTASTATAFDVSEGSVLTDAMLDAGFSEDRDTSGDGDV